MSLKRIRWSEASAEQRASALARPAMQRSEALAASVRPFKLTAATEIFGDAAKVWEAQ